MSQYILSSMLGDKKFTRNYISENQKRLKKDLKKMLVNGLQKAGISCLKTNNDDLLCWVDYKVS